MDDRSAAVGQGSEVVKDVPVFSSLEEFGASEFSFGDLFANQAVLVWTSVGGAHVSGPLSAIAFANRGEDVALFSRDAGVLTHLSAIDNDCFGLKLVEEKGGIDEKALSASDALKELKGPVVVATGEREIRGELILASDLCGRQVLVVQPQGSEKQEWLFWRDCDYVVRQQSV